MKNASTATSQTNAPGGNQKEQSVSEEEKVTKLHVVADGPADSRLDEAAQAFFESTISDPNADSRQIGRILIETGRLTPNDIERIAQVQQRDGIFFGEAAKKLKLLNDNDIQHALAKQFNYPYLKISDGIFSEELIAAYKPFSVQAETLRSVRSQLLLSFRSPGCQVMAVVSPSSQDGRSFLAANLAVMFAQLNKRTLLIDADLRSPRQHEIFRYRCRVGLSAMLAGRVRKDDLDRLPEAVPFFTHLSVLGAGAAPPNPLELLAGDRLPRIIRELSIYYDLIIIDTPPANAQADYQAISACAGNAVVVTRKAHSKLADIKKMTAALDGANVRMLGAILNDY